MAKVKELFAAYKASELPTDGGFIITSSFDEHSTYSKYEVTSYNNVKDIYQNEDGLVFQADGFKQFVLVEPSNYNEKHVEPAMRDAAHAIPYRFKEVDTFVSKRQDRVMVGKEPVVTYGSFTILKPVGENFAYVVYKDDSLLDTVQEFFAKSIWQDARVPKLDAEKISKHLSLSLKRIAYPAQEE